MRATERERRDWIIIPIILLIGFLCVIIAGRWALHFSPYWKLNAAMESKLNPNSYFLTHRPDGFIEPVDASILTAPFWINGFLTPGASFATETPLPTMTATLPFGPTTMSLMTNTVVVTASPTNTFASIFWVPSSTPQPKDTNGPTATPTATATVTVISTDTSTSTATLTATATSTPTSTPTTMQTPTNTPIPIPTDPTPANIGTTPDGVAYNLPSGGMLTLGINLVVNGHSGWDLVYYEYPAGSGILLDWVIIEISDGNNWYTVFNWGNNIADTNTNMDFNILSNPQIPEEPDQRDIPTAELYNSTGIAIDLDSMVPPGTYSYIRIIAPPGDVDNQTEIDAISVLP